MKTTINADTREGWKARLENLKKDISLSDKEYNKSKHTLKNLVNQKVNKAFKDKADQNAKIKSKVQHLRNGKPLWEPGKMREYSLHLFSLFFCIESLWRKPPKQAHGFIQNTHKGGPVKGG